jgi:hypothetical protein
MNHYGMSSEDLSHIIVDAIAAPSNLVNDDNGKADDLFLGMNIFAMPAKEDAAPDDEEHYIKKTSFVRKGSNGSPVCVSSFFDDAMGNSVNRSFNSELDVVNRIIVYTDHAEDDESMEFVDPDKLEKAISELCDPILMREGKQGMFE